MARAAESPGRLRVESRKSKKAPLAGACIRHRRGKRRYFTNPVAYLRVMLTPKTTPEVVLSR